MARAGADGGGRGSGRDPGARAGRPRVACGRPDASRVGAGVRPRRRLGARQGRGREGARARRDLEHPRPGTLPRVAAEPELAARSSEMTLPQALVAEIDHENASTRKLIDLFPDAKFGWRPHAKCWTVGELATHLSSLPTWVGRVLDASELDLAPILGTRFE